MAELLAYGQQFFASFFQGLTLPGIGLALAMGVVWLVPFLPPLHRRLWLWWVLVVSALLTLVAVVCVQIPLQALTSNLLVAIWGQETLTAWLLLAGIPTVLFSGLVQEGAKMVPMVLYWLKRGRKLTPKEGLALGAVAGVAFGAFEAQWALNSIFNAGAPADSWLGIWERISAVALHTGVSALVGYGLARGRGWQFWLLGSGLHGLTNYSVVLLQQGVLTVMGLEIYATVIAALVLGAALWLRWRPESGETEAAATGGAPETAAGEQAD